MRLLLFGTSGCHLCEQAVSIINECMADDFDLMLEGIDIAEFDHWQTQFALRIPVLYHPETQQDLGWPFDHKQVRKFISELSHG
jgi:hypothetical protein